MRQSISTALVVSALSAFLIVQSNTAFAQTQTSAQEPHQAQIFAPETISNGEVFATTFSPDGKTVYFCQSSKDRQNIRIMQSRQKHGTWAKPVQMPFTGAYRDIDPFVAPDGKRLYFNSTRPIQSNDTTSSAGFHIWYCDWRRGAWTAPMALPAPVTSDTANESFATVTRSGDVYFGYRTPNNPTLAGVYVSERKKGQYLAPKRVTAGTVSELGNPYIAPDGRYLIFVSGKPDTATDSDLFITFRQNDVWSEPIRLGGAVNTDLAEFAPNVHQGRLYFTRMKRGKDAPIAEENIYSISLSSLNIKGLR